MHSNELGTEALQYETNHNSRMNIQIDDLNNLKQTNPETIIECQELCCLLKSTDLDC
jgi:hypothetical protein